MNFLRYGLAGALAVAAFACNSLVGVDFNDAQLEGAPNVDGQRGDAAAPNTATTTDKNGNLCTPKTCAQLARVCGVSDDGCGNAVDCGACAGGGECQNGQCQCVPTTCPAAGFNCDTVSDGCGNVVDCGTCHVAGDECTAGKCGCVSTTCEAEGVTCGQLPDGCGNTLECGGCDGATPICNAGHCAAEPCEPTTCAAQGKNCNSISNGCGTAIPCGNCTAPASCGGGGVANVCGCTPLTCAQIGASCGNQPNGCGGTINCGGCAAGTTCGGGGNPKACGCTPNPNACAGKNCGVVDNGCGTQIGCGNCVAPNNTCSGNVCSCAYTGCSAGCGPGTDNCGNACNLGACCVSTTCRRTCIDNCGNDCDYGLCGVTCFAAGTEIRLADGSTRPIENVRVGDLIATYDPETGETHAARVTEAISHEADESPERMVLINGRLRVTPNHPLLVNGQRVNAGKLKAGDVLTTHAHLDALRTQSVVLGVAPSLPTLKVESLPGAVRTYDLRTEDGAGFYADDVLVLLKPIDPIEP